MSTGAWIAFWALAWLLAMLTLGLGFSALLQWLDWRAGRATVLFGLGRGR